MLRTLFLTVTVVILSTNMLQAETTSPVHWRTNLAEAARSARASDTPIVIFVESESCHYCVRMKRQTLASPQVHTALHHFLPVRINAAQNRSLAAKLGVRAFPTTIIAAPDGAVLRIAEGYLSPAEFYAELVAAHRKWRLAGDAIAQTR